MPIPDAVSVSVAPANELSHDLPEAYVERILDEIGIKERGWKINVESRLPFGKGLGSSAAIAVAMARAFNTELGLGLDDARINAIAFASEQLAHGTPSGVDNTLSTYALPMLFSNDGELRFETIETDETPPLVIAWGDETGKTSEQVAGVRERYEQAPARASASIWSNTALNCSGACS